MIFPSTHLKATAATGVAPHIGTSEKIAKLPVELARDNGDCIQTPALVTKGSSSL
jgi:hypothetical protein